MKQVLDIVKDEGPISTLDLRKTLLQRGVDFRGQFSDILQGLKLEGLVRPAHVVHVDDNNNEIVIRGWVVVEEDKK